MPEHDPQRVFELLAAELPPAAFEVTSFEGKEAMSSLYRFDVRARTAVPDMAQLERSLAGKEASLVVRGQGHDRHVSGVVTRVTKGEVDQRGHQHVVVRLRPKLWLLGRRTNCRIFQEKKVHEIVAELLDEWRVEHQLLLSRAYEARTYCVQYHETDLAFIRRILAEEGLFFFFEMPPAPHAPALLLLADSPLHFRPIAGGTIDVRAPSGMNAPDDVIDELSVRRALKPGRAAVREYDWVRPALHDAAAAELEERARDIDYDERALEDYRHYDDYEPSAVGKEAADLHLEQLRRKAEVALGTSHSRRLYPGVRFPVVGDAKEPELWVVTSVEHAGTRPTSEGSGRGEDLYANTFRCAPGAEAFRPPRPRRPRQQTIETAVVVGPDKEEIHTDRWGRIKVQFHWDRAGNRDEHSSCWMRVMQTWAGTGWGFQFVPRVGMEVLVLFTTGDADKPIVIGSAYNGAQPVPFALPANQTKSGIKTRSVFDPEGYNELSFEDQAGRERVHVHAQKDLDLHVRNARSAHVGATDSTSVGGDSSLHVGGHETRVVNRSLTETIGETVTKTYRANADVAVGGNAFLDVLGAAFVSSTQSMTLTTDASLTTTIGAGYSLGVGGDATVRYGRDFTATVGGEASADVTGALLVMVTDSAQLVSGSELTLAANTAIRLVCGDSVLEMTPDEVVITSKSIVFAGADKVAATGSSATLTLDGDVEVGGGTTTLAGSGATLTLDGDASLQGGSVKLKSGGGTSNSTDSSGGEEPPPPPKLGVATHVGHGRESDTGVKLVVEDKDGAELATLEASAAASSGDGNLTWELDPDDYDGVIKVVRVDEQGRRSVVVGPVDPKHLRKAMVSGELGRLQAMTGRRKQASAQPGLVLRQAPRAGFGVTVHHEAGSSVGASAEDAHEDWSGPPGGDRGGEP